MANRPELTIPLDGEHAVKCPRCQSDSGLHFDEVSLIDPAADVVPLHAAGGEGLSVVAATIGDGSQPGRHHLIVLPHWCATCGERGELVLRQDSGQTVAQYRELAGSTATDD